jgi:hypothetical protein
MGFSVHVDASERLSLTQIDNLPWRTSVPVLAGVLHTGR